MIKVVGRVTLFARVYSEGPCSPSQGGSVTVAEASSFLLRWSVNTFFKQYQSYTHASVQRHGMLTVRRVFLIEVKSNDANYVKECKKIFHGLLVCTRSYGAVKMSHVWIRRFKGWYRRCLSVHSLSGQATPDTARCLGRGMVVICNRKLVVHVRHILVVRFSSP